jgi:hypothetical protein
MPIRESLPDNVIRHSVRKGRGCRIEALEIAAIEALKKSMLCGLSSRIGAVYQDHIKRSILVNQGDVTMS